MDSMLSNNKADTSHMEDGSDFQQSRNYEHLKSLQEREQYLSNIVHDLNLDESAWSTATKKHIEELTEILMDLDVTEVNRTNILAAFARKALLNSAKGGSAMELKNQSGRLTNVLETVKAMNSSYQKAITVYKNGISEMNETLGPSLTNVSSTEPLSPKSPPVVNNNMDRHKNILSLCQKLANKKREIQTVQEKLNQFAGLPFDVEAAKYEVAMKRRDLEDLEDQWDKIADD